MAVDLQAIKQELAAAGALIDTAATDKTALDTAEAQIDSLKTAADASNSALVAAFKQIVADATEVIAASDAVPST